VQIEGGRKKGRKEGKENDEKEREGRKKVKEGMEGRKEGPSVVQIKILNVGLVTEFFDHCRN
jgi:hypothetical protein